MKEVVFSLFLFIVFFTADVLNLDTDSNLPQTNEIINETYVYEELNDDYVYEPEPVQEEEIIYIDVEDYFEENQTEDSFYQDETETVEIPTPELNETEIPPRRVKVMSQIIL